MYIGKNYSLLGIIRFTWIHILWLAAWATIVTLFYELSHSYWLKIPWLPISVIGTAVAFYVGFKNNSSYDRMWEARKIWGAIINSSRMWGVTVRSYVGNQFRDKPENESTLSSIHQRLLYRHLAWLYTLRSQLLIPTPWEHISQNKYMKRFIENRKKKFGVGLYEDDVTEKMLEKLLDDEEMHVVINFQNTATQLIDKQSQELK